MHKGARLSSLTSNSGFAFAWCATIRVNIEKRFTCNSLSIVNLLCVRGCFERGNCWQLCHIFVSKVLLKWFFFGYSIIIVMEIVTTILHALADVLRVSSTYLYLARDASRVDYEENASMHRWRLAERLRDLRWISQSRDDYRNCPSRIYRLSFLRNPATPRVVHLSPVFCVGVTHNVVHLYLIMHSSVWYLDGQQIVLSQYVL